MKLLFVSGLYSNRLKDILIEKDIPIQNAPNVFQWAIIEGLIANEVEMEVLSYPFLPCFPTIKTFSIPKEDIIYGERKIGEIMSYSALPIWKQYSIASSIKSFVEGFLKKNTEEQVVVLTYTPLSYFVNPIIELKKKYENLLLATIVTDLVDDALNFNVNTSFAKRIQNNLEYRAVKKAYHSIDKFILLSQPMVEKIPDARGKYIIVEGITSEVEWICKKKNNDGIKSLFYSGTLEIFSGVQELLQTFRRIPNEYYRLVICGQGVLTPEIELAAKQDNRIIYKGMLPREEVLRLQQEATLLINPRRPDSEITRFSFPSKTMEYLVSGTPMIGYKLEGIPSEYYDHYYTIDGLSEECLVNAIQSTMDLPQDILDTKAKSAYNFVMQNKTAKMQTKRILDFLMDVNA